jgi:hypothetical protein
VQAVARPAYPVALVPGVAGVPPPGAGGDGLPLSPPHPTKVQHISTTKIAVSQCFIAHSLLGNHLSEQSERTSLRHHFCKEWPSSAHEFGTFRWPHRETETNRAQFRLRFGISRSDARRARILRAGSSTTSTSRSRWLASTAAAQASNRQCCE